MRKDIKINGRLAARVAPHGERERRQANWTPSTKWRRTIQLFLRWLKNSWRTPRTLSASNKRRQEYPSQNVFQNLSIENTNYDMSSRIEGEARGGSRIVKGGVCTTTTLDSKVRIGDLQLLSLVILLALGAILCCVQEAYITWKKLYLFYQCKCFFKMWTIEKK